MEQRRTIFDYIAQVFCIFGFTMVIMMSFAITFGESGKDYSMLLALGKRGVSSAVMFEFLALSVINVFLRYLFMTDRFIKEMSFLKRTICTVISILITIIAFIVLFGWFPTDMWQPWALFVGSFILCFTIGTFVTSVRNKMENKKLADGLARMRENWGMEDGTEE